LSRGAKLLAASYMAAAFAFSFDLLFKSNDGPMSGVLLESFSYLLAASLFAAAIFVRAGRNPPLVLLIFIGLGGWLADIYLAAIGEHVARSMFLGCWCAIITALPLSLVRHHMARGIDIGLMVLTFILFASLFTSSTLLAPELSNDAFIYEESNMSAAISMIVNVSSVFVASLLLIDYVNQRMRRLLREAHQDPMTGLLNRRGFEDRVNALIAAANETGHPGVLLVGDIDKFKSINDVHGHAKGDEVIKAFAQTLQQQLPPDALIARFGGEEVCAALPLASPAMGRIMAEGAKTSFTRNAPRLVEKGDERKVTASFGVAVFQADFQSTFAKADKALFEAKSAGRDRVVLARAKVSTAAA
ncbi:MAG: GGDEF domain-containing protein, partial [Pseudomonadota bacterium]